MKQRNPQHGNEVDWPIRFMTQAEYARHLGVHRSSVHRMLRDGRIALNGMGLIDVARADEELEAQTDWSKPRNYRHPHGDNPLRGG